MDMQLSGARVVVSAGAAGIGLEIARAFLREGARVEICDADRDAVASLAGTDPAIGAQVCDVADRGAVAAFMAHALARLGGLDVLVNNAGIAGPTGRVDEIGPEGWDRCLEVCLTGQFNLTRLAVAALSRSGNPSIVNMSSAAGKFGFGLRSAYAAAKWGVIGFTQSIAIELGPLGIRVNAICPGTVEGDRIRRVFQAKAQAQGRSEAEVRAGALANTALARMIEAGEIADMCVFLASPRAKTISGQAISIDAGKRAME